MVENWNRCLHLADTELVTLLHADDELRDSYAGTLKSAAERYPWAAALFCEAEVIDAGGAPCFSFPDWIKRFLRPGRGRTVRLEGPRGIGALLRGNFIMCPTLCYRKSLLQGRRFAPRWRMVQDLELTTRLLLEGESLVGIPDVAYRYRRHPHNATAQYTRNLLRFHEESALYELLGEESSSRGWGAVARIARGKSIIKLNLAYSALHDLLGLQSRFAWEKLWLLGGLFWARKPVRGA
jgi:hypothetical protein